MTTCLNAAATLRVCPTASQVQGMDSMPAFTCASTAAKVADMAS